MLNDDCFACFVCFCFACFDASQDTKSWFCGPSQDAEPGFAVRAQELIFFLGNKALSAEKTIAELWDDRLGGAWSGCSRRREGSLSEGSPPGLPLRTSP